MTTTYKYKIRWSHGTTATHATYEAAIDAVRAVFTHAEIGHDGDISEGGASTLVWASEDLARDDDGSRVVAKIVALHEDREEGAC